MSGLKLSYCVILWLWIGLCMVHSRNSPSFDTVENIEADKENNWQVHYYILSHVLKYLISYKENKLFSWQ